VKRKGKKLERGRGICLESGKGGRCWWEGTEEKRDGKGNRLRAAEPSEEKKKGRTKGRNGSSERKPA